MNNKIVIISGVFLTTLAACANEAVFVTSTSVGINLDAKTQSTSLAYDRQEGYLGPTYADGTPSVVASLQTNGKIFSPTVMQAYATGDAAKIAVGGNPTVVDNPTFSGKGKTAFFGTSTTTGIKFGFAPGTSVPDEMVFGFKRQELTFIPLLENTNGTEKKYASTLAFYDMKRSATTDGDFRDKQYFATGVAAEHLASLPAIRQLFEDAAQEAALAKWDSVTEQQRGLAAAITKCYSDVPLQVIPSIWQDAAGIGLIADSQFLGKANSWYSNVDGLSVNDDQKRLDLYRYGGAVGPSEDYLAFIRKSDDTEARTDLLLDHIRTVCAAAN